MDCRLDRLADLAESSIGLAVRELGRAGVKGLLPVVARLRRLGLAISLLGALAVQDEGEDDGRNR
ncbi:hypothetical protein LZ518_09965 [Sphingomonas sp. RB56-2]|uniref:Uncharacterized protein n=1 Tax=Sphingomonas brevis TaxID=2908206 RepID=A0ABT0SBL4_9SPHN|nr:hypothetical protein [Sphingomonas brevis]MCL6741456.1 hypothetical protein [Sphingomonas brevis]